MQFKLIVAGNYFQYKRAYNPISRDKQKLKQSLNHAKHLKEDYGFTPEAITSKRKDNLSVSRNNFKLLAHANLTKHSKFITLTTQENMEINKFQRLFQLWIKRAERETGLDFKYLGAYELQERGAPHIHLILFNSDYLPWQPLYKHWLDLIQGKGTLQIKEANEKHINYVVAYIHLDTLETLKKKAIIRSRNLIKPQVYKDTIPAIYQDNLLRIEYSRVFGSSSTTNMFENIFGYFDKRGDTLFDEVSKFAYISSARMKAFSEAKAKRNNRPIEERSEAK
jgi:hypothetical protein